MKIWKLRRKRKLIIIFLVSFFAIYFITTVYFSFVVDPLIVFQSIIEKRLLLITLLLLFSLMLFLVLYNLFQVVRDRIGKKEGSRFRLRLTLFFLIVTLIPVVPLALISNNLISRSINLWFVSGIEDSLMDALEVSKELYGKLTRESVEEWERFCLNCSEEEIKSIGFKTIDGVLSFSKEGDEMRVVFLKDLEVTEYIDQNLKFSDIEPHGWRRINTEKHDYLLTPVKSGAGRRYVLIREIPDNIRNHTAQVSAGLQNYRTLKVIREPAKGIIILLFTALIMPFVLLSFYLSLLISREVTDPIKELVIATQKVAGDDLTYTINLKAKDELKLLINSFNKMTRDLRVNKELLKHSERSAAWRDIARKIAHEIKNPLTPIKLSAERMLKLYDRNDSYREVLKKGITTILREVETITRMVNEFYEFARFPETRLGRHDVVPLINEILDLLKNTHREITFAFNHTTESAFIMIDAAQVRIALLNIIYNSINAVKENGIITISCYPGSGPGNGSYIIAINDNGTGIDPDIRDRIFEPYFSKDGRGIGLGLAIVEKIVLDNKGRIWFESEPGNTTFYMEFTKA
jgi:nitrogen fixation/metabolism regulation signal transduction histidine kinase